MMKKLDFNEDGRFDFNEYVCMVVIQVEKSDTMEEELVQVFKRFDKDGDGEIDCNDLYALFQELGQELDWEECQDMLYCFDADNDSKINFREFVQVMLYKSND